MEKKTIEIETRLNKETHNYRIPDKLFILKLFKLVIEFRDE